jgi:hypothetical protein
MLSVYWLRGPVTVTSRLGRLPGYWREHDFPILDDARTSKARRTVG